jgi:uncharacterized protein (TIGR03437 family)
MRTGTLLLLSAVFIAPLLAQPLVYYRGIVNAGSYMPAGLPAGSIARGSVFTIFGRGLGPSSSPSLSFPLSNNLGGVTVQVLQGSSAVNAIPVFVSDGQINAIMPSNAPLGANSLRVSYNGRSSNQAPINIANSSFGIYTATGTGIGPGIVQNFTSGGTPLNTNALAARSGQTVILWGAGLGPAPFPDNVAPTVMNLATKTEVFVGGVSAPVTYAGRSGCCAGSDEVIFNVPATAPTGCWVPVYVRTEGKIVSNVATMAIDPGGLNCAEPANAFAAPLIKGGNLAAVLAMRHSVKEDAGTSAPVEAVSDYIWELASKETGGLFSFNPTLSIPPPGACTAYSVVGDLGTNALPPGATGSGQALDAGTKVTLSGGASPISVSLSNPGGLTLGEAGAAVTGLSWFPSSLVLNPGSFTLNGPGGTQIGAFQAAFTMPTPLAWTNRDQLSLVNRSQGVTLNFAGATTGATVVASGIAVDLPHNSSAMFLCVAAAGANSITVSPDMLANFPATTASTSFKSAIYLGQWSFASPTLFQASGLDIGAVMPVSIIGKTVSFQ